MRPFSRQLQGSFNTAVLRLKGGIGKTSTTVGVGLTLGRVSLLSLPDQD